MKGASRSDLPHLSTSRSTFTVVWSAVVLAHVISGFYLTSIGTIHLILYLAPVFIELSNITEHRVLVGSLYLVVGALHWCRIIEIMVYSVRDRELSFGSIWMQSPSSWSNTNVSARTRHKSFALTVRTHSVTFKRRALQTICRLWIKYFAPNGLFGVFGPYYDPRRDLIDIPSHVVQAFSMSYCVRPVFSLLAAVVIMINCVLHGCVNRIFHNSDEFARRTYLVLCDVILDTILGAIVPMVLILPLTLQYLDHITNIILNYSDVSYSEGILRLQQIVVKDALDFVTKVSPFVINYSTLHTVGVLFARYLRRKPTIRRQRRVHVLAITAGPQQSDMNRPSARKWTQASGIPVAGGTRLSWIFKLMRLCTACAGVSIFVIAVVASGLVIPREPCPVGCMYQTAPWLSRSCNCIVQEFNCIAMNQTGLALSEPLLDYPTTKLSMMLFNHCPELHVPAPIRRFRELLGIGIYNSELARWDEDAAITDDAFDMITFVYFIKTNVSRIPPGLLTNLAPTMYDFELISSHITPEIPEDLATAWPFVTQIYLEDCGLTSIPPPILQLKGADQLSVSNNHIRELPDNLFQAPIFQNLTVLLLALNPIAALPSTLENATSLIELYVDNTAIAALPGRGPLNSTLYVSAWNASLCSNSTDNEAANATIVVSCDGLYDNIFRYGVFPLDPRVRAERRPTFLSTLV